VVAQANAVGGRAGPKPAAATRHVVNRRLTARVRLRGAREVGCLGRWARAHGTKGSRKWTR
jgi:hypothetical protein